MATKPIANLQRMAKHIEMWLVDKLIPWARNPRTHSDAQVAQIAASIDEFGFNNPILVDTKAGIIAGHGRLLAARKLGLIEVPVIVLDHLTDAQKRAYVITDNKLAENAGWDDDLLRIEIEALQDENFDVSLLGFEDIELAQLLAAKDAPNGLTDEDSIPELPEKPVCKAGDLWVLGEHKLLVGDSTNQGDVTRLMGGEVADLVFTDPPFNVDYEGYTEQRLKMQGDRMSDADFKHFLEAAFRGLRTAVKSGASLYVCHSSSWQREFQNALESAGFQVRCQIIWAKNTFAWGFGRYKFRHEPLFYCHVAGQKDPWYGDKTQSTLWEEKKPATNRIHPTAKPVELIERALLNSSKTGDIVADLFGGSGSTLIACERRGRRARLMEIDPKYADCIVRRFREYSGNSAVLDGDGARFRDGCGRARQGGGVNRALPPGDRGHRKGHLRWASRYRGTLPGFVGLVGGTAEPHKRATNCGEVNWDAREIMPAVGPPGRSSRCRRSRESSSRCTEQSVCEIIREHLKARGYVQTGNESLAETTARAFGMNSQELRNLMSGPVEAFKARLQSL